MAGMTSHQARHPASEVQIAIEGVHLFGLLTVPAASRALVLFAHGSGSGRRSPRNQHVANRLNSEGLATLLFDLLTPGEELDRENVFDIPMLGGRLRAVSHWAHDQPGLGDQAVGYFGASTGAGAALWAAGGEPGVFAIVSRGGRPDLAGGRLPEVQAPTLLIVGGRDPVVERLNREAQARLRCESELVIIPGATHLFEEDGALDEVARLAGNWLRGHVPQPEAKEVT
jgi:putative phosphoribosyl transferase